MRLTPDQFWKLTPAEFRDAAQGAIAREKRFLNHLAWAVANLMNVHPIKKRVTPKMLLGQGFSTEMEKRRAWEESVKPKLDKKKVN